MATSPKDTEKILEITKNDPDGSAETVRPNLEPLVPDKPFKLPLAKQSRSWWPFVLSFIGFVFLVGMSILMYNVLQPPHIEQASITPETSPAPSTSSKVTFAAQQLDISKDYGNKYANGLLPVGDGKYSTTGAKKGSLYVCSTYAKNLSTDGGGADARGPWFTKNNTQYDINKKSHIGGSVKWYGTYTNIVNGAVRKITTNDLPLTHVSGIFPVQSTDPAYAYDRNSNAIKAQDLTFSLTANPSYGATQCMGGQAGVMTTGVALFNAFDAGGRDAGAWEVQDNCGGHPEMEGEYHYHTLSSCITDISVQTVIGFALDGFPITGPKLTATSILTTDDLDVCHGTTSEVLLDGKKKTTYHYVMTQDFPYSVSCFRAKAINPPGQPSGAQQTAVGQALPSATPAPGQTPPPKQPVQ